VGHTTHDTHNPPTTPNQQKLQRKVAALEVEQAIKRLAAAGDHRRARAAIDRLIAEYAFSAQANHRKVLFVMVVMVDCCGLCAAGSCEDFEAAGAFREESPKTHPHCPAPSPCQTKRNRARCCAWPPPRWA
jgi:hypothetical protein